MKENEIGDIVVDCADVIVQTRCTISFPRAAWERRCDAQRREFTTLAHCGGVPTQRVGTRGSERLRADLLNFGEALMKGGISRITNGNLE